MEIQYNTANSLGKYELGSSLRGFELSRSIYMQVSTNGNGNLVRVSEVSSYPGFECMGLYCKAKGKVRERNTSVIYVDIVLFF